MSECGRRSLGPHVMCPALGWYGYGYGDGCSSLVSLGVAGRGTGTWLVGLAGWLADTMLQ